MTLNDDAFHEQLKQLKTPEHRKIEPCSEGKVRVDKWGFVDEGGIFHFENVITLHNAVEKYSILYIKYCGPEKKRKRSYFCFISSLFANCHHKKRGRNMRLE